MNEFYCSTCSAQYELIYDKEEFIPEFCPFCGSGLEDNEDESEEELFYDEDKEW
jgi:DNA-directed RNA polymerase subunit RPC12/RpoP